MGDVRIHVLDDMEWTLQGKFWEQNPEPNRSND